MGLCIGRGMRRVLVRRSEEIIGVLEEREGGLNTDANASYVHACR